MGFAFDSAALPADLPVAPDYALALQEFLESARHQVRDAFFVDTAGWRTMQTPVATSILCSTGKR